MKEKFKKYRFAAISFFVAVGALFLGKKIVLFSAAPTEEKPCDFIYPESPDQTKPTRITIETPAELDILKQKGGVTNDASCLNKTAVYGVVKVTSVEDVEKTLAFARDNSLKITSAGSQHSMGGQSFIRGGIVLDMKGYNHVNVDVENKVVTVGSGATWEKIQQALDAEGLAVNAMQSINIFTVGGTLSVNAHGLGHQPGPVAPTVRSMRVMLPSGAVVNASPTENADLFSHVLGGYGLFGVILEVDIDVMENEVYEWNTEYIAHTDFNEHYKNNIDGNHDIGLTYSRMSVAPHSYMKEVAVHTFKKVDFKEEIPELEPWGNTTVNRFIINFSKTGSFGRWTRWMLEKYVEPSTHTCISRNQAMSQRDVCYVSRNQEMYDSMGYLKNKLKDTDILNEYFIPRDKMDQFIDGLKEVVQTNDANLLNVTVRTIDKDEVTSLPYAKEDMFAFVLYFNQKLNKEEAAILQKTTVDLIDLSTNLGGTFYLPYQLYYSPEQLRKAYPEVDDFFKVKLKYDPNELFVNTWYEKYKPHEEAGT